MLIQSHSHPWSLWLDRYTVPVIVWLWKWPSGDRPPRENKFTAEWFKWMDYFKWIIFISVNYYKSRDYYCLVWVINRIDTVFLNMRGEPYFPLRLTLCLLCYFAYIKRLRFTGTISFKIIDDTYSFRSLPC